MEGLKEYILKEDAVAAVMETDPHVFLTYNKKKEKTEIVVAQITEEVLEEIKKIPAADVEPRWIPVTERLPEVGSEVLVCYDFNGIRSVYISNFYGDGEFHGLDDEYLTNEGRRYRKAVAWMPLPTPYKSGEEE